MTAKTVNEILREASDIMDRRGKCSGQAYEPNTGKVCSIGAINMATFGEDRMARIYKGFESEISLYDNMVHWNNSIAARRKLTTSIGGVGIASWSDATDEATVIAALRDVSKEE